MKKPAIFTTLNAIGQAIFDKKGSNILAIDVQGISSITDFVIIAEGNIDRHLKALAQTVKEKLDEFGEKPIFIEGEGGDWVILDYGNFVIHLLTAEFREKYSLEELWRKAKIIDLKIKVAPKKKSKNEEQDE